MFPPATPPWYLDAMPSQRALVADAVPDDTGRRAARSGSFVDNMSLPLHRWFRYSAGFAAQWVEHVLARWKIVPGQVVLDPFAGSGTVLLVGDALGIDTIGVEAHPVVARVCEAKLAWRTPAERIGAFAAAVAKSAKLRKADLSKYPSLITRSFDAVTLATLDRLREAWLELRDDSAESELVWLALTAILRSASTAGTAQWQYILPNKTKKNVLEPSFAFAQHIEMMKADVRWMQTRARKSHAELIGGDARKLALAVHRPIDAVITSPPYANNYDYADALRFEMTFWGEIGGWGDIHETVRKLLVVSSSQHASRERLRSEALLEEAVVQPIRDELAQVVETLGKVRESHGGKKHYHTMVAAYCRDIGLVLKELRRICKSGARMCWVIGDSAPYGIYCPIDEWIGTLAVAAGFKRYRFEKLRDRNIKWKNRKHRVPLKEGLLWIDG